ncbi:acid protease [Meredithblackwellia eburnea MCA 4105]
MRLTSLLGLGAALLFRVAGATATLQVPFGTHQVIHLSSPSKKPLSSIPVVDWSALERLRDRHGPRDKKTQALALASREEERAFFTELLGEIMGGEDKIPHMFDELVGKEEQNGDQRDGRGDVAVSSTAGGGDKNLKAEQALGTVQVLPEFVATLTYGARTAELVHDGMSGDLWIVEGDCKVALPRATAPQRVHAVLDSGSDAPSTVGQKGSKQSHHNIIATINKLSGEWETSIVSSILADVVPFLDSRDEATFCTKLRNDFQPRYTPATFSFHDKLNLLVVLTADDDAFRSPLQWLPNDAQAEWQVNVNGFNTLNGTTAPSTAWTRMDTGTGAFAVLPMRDAFDLHQRVPGVPINPIPGRQGFYSYPCHEAFTLILQLEDGVEARIPPSSLTLGRLNKDSDQCVSSIVGAEEETQSVLGRLFLENLYSVFDTKNRKLGLALRA